MLKRCATVVLGFFLTVSVNADELTDAALGLCEKVKDCALAQISTEQMTPQVRQMMEPMLENMCTNMRSQVEEVATGHALYKPAVACMRSMQNMSCQEMQNSQGQKTAECEAYQELAEKTSDKP